MDELTRFARQLVERLKARPEGLARPVALGEVRSTLLPYRANRKALGLDTVDDYETVLLRLAAEERGFVKTLPAAAAERCRKELAQANPDLGVLDELEQATVQLTSMAAARILEDESVAAVEAAERGGTAERAAGREVPEFSVTAELASPGASRPARRTVPSPAPARTAGSAERTPDPSKLPAPQLADPLVACPKCENGLPENRQVVFCPWCGERLIPFTCQRCGTRLESEWTHCITCGASVKDPYRFS